MGACSHRNSDHRVYWLKSIRNIRMSIPQDPMSMKSAISIFYQMVFFSSTRGAAIKLWKQMFTDMNTGRPPGYRYMPPNRDRCWLLTVLSIRISGPDLQMLTYAAA